MLPPAGFVLGKVRRDHFILAVILGYFKFLCDCPLRGIRGLVVLRQGCRKVVDICGYDPIEYRGVELSIVNREEWGVELCTANELPLINQTIWIFQSFFSAPCKVTF